jgi:hypothetical protein
VEALGFWGVTIEQSGHLSLIKEGKRSLLPFGN